MKHHLARTWLVAALLAAVLSATPARSAAASSAHPNIIFILSDDLGYGDIGCCGATHVKTPHLDRLAQEGTRFTDAHSTASVCTPTRYAFMTGRYAWREAGTGIAAGNAPSLIQPGTATVASVLKSAGYRTGVVGKWHLGLGGPGPTDFNGEIRPGPLELGFDYAFIIPATGDRVPCVFVENRRVVGLDPADPIRVRYGVKIGDEPTGADPGVQLKIQGGPGHKDTVVNGIPRIGFMTGGKAARWVDEDIADTLAAKAVKFIEANRAGPFFLCFTPHDIHEPMVPHPRFRGASGCGWRGDVIHQLDWEVGEVLAALDRLHLATNTLVIFTSDNGGAIKNTYDDGTNPLHSRQAPNGALRGFKGSLYEGGHRVPFLARWPGRIPAGGVSGQLIAHVDTLATLAALTGQRLDAEAGPDSFNVLSALLGQPGARGRDHLVLQNNNQAPLALRQGDWILIGKGGGRQPQQAPAAPRPRAQAPAYELFNLASDPAQTNNLAANEPARVKQMAARLDQLRAQGRSRPDAGSAVAVSGELKQWHKVTLTMDGPLAHERDADPNPFTDYAMNVTFAHESGSPRYVVPGYFAADGDAANTSAESGTKWRAHLSPDKSGAWTYSISFVRGKQVAVSDAKGQAVKPFDGQTGRFVVGPTDKAGRDFRAQGRLEYVGQHHLQFAGSKEFFLKAGPDAPETLLAYADFDGTESGRKRNARSGEAAPTESLHRYAPHLRDWRDGDPTWKGGKGKGLIGALNYLAGKGLNAFSFLTYNAAGDGDNVWPFVARNDKVHWDCSKLDQWGIVFDHATAQGLYLHFKLQENEIDDDRPGNGSTVRRVPESLDGGKLGPERRLYCRELVARFAHALALNWNIGEENTQSTEEIRDMVKFIHDTDPYHHHIVIHTYPNQQDKVYTPLLGSQSLLTGLSLQNGWSQTHARTVKWIAESAAAGRPWVVANDEQGGADTGVPPDLGYDGYNGKKKDGQAVQTPDDIRQAVLWGNLLGGGAGVEYYFGYQLPQNDLNCEDFRSRDRSWGSCRIALEFFRDNRIPFWEMKNMNSLIGNAKNDNSKYCLAKPGELYLVYLPAGGTTDLDLGRSIGAFDIGWFNPRAGGPLMSGSVQNAAGPGKISIGRPPSDPGQDWLAIVRARR